MFRRNRQTAPIRNDSTDCSVTSLGGRTTPLSPDHTPTARTPSGRDLVATGTEQCPNTVRTCSQSGRHQSGRGGEYRDCRGPPTSATPGDDQWYHDGVTESGGAGSDLVEQSGRRSHLRPGHRSPPPAERRCQSISHLKQGYHLAATPVRHVARDDVVIRMPSTARPLTFALPGCSAVGVVARDATAPRSVCRPIRG
jgi:hypothetical protein